MNCGKCGVFVLSLDKICFYKLKDGTHFALKKEVSYTSIEQTLRKVSTGKSFLPHFLNCASCDQKLMTGVNVEQNILSCLGDHCVVNEVKYKGKDKKMKERLMAAMEVRTSIEEIVEEMVDGIDVIEEIEEIVRVETVRPGIEDVPWNEISFVLAPRDYQMELLLRCVEHNTIVYLPTGYGKTLVAVMMINYVRMYNPEKMIIFCAPTVPLVCQQSRVLKDQTNNLKILCLHKDMISKKAYKQISSKEYDVIVTTPGCYKNIIDKIRFEDVSLCVFDEVHHAKKKHDYTKILHEIQKLPHQYRPLFIGLTASPVTNLANENSIVELEKMCDARLVRPVLLSNSRSPIDPEHIILTPTNSQLNFISELKDFITILQKQDERIKSLNIHEEHKFIQAVRTMIMYDEENDTDTALLQQILEILGYIEMIPIIGVVKTLDIVYEDNELNEDFIYKLRTMELPNDDFDSSRLKIAKDILSNVLDSGTPTETLRILLFVERRKTCAYLVEYLYESFPGLKPKKFVGHTQADGMDHFKQQSTIELFEKGDTKLLVCTSVLEEGIDVPACNIIIRFSGRLTLRSYIQSRGRARFEDSHMYLICTEEERQDYMKILEEERKMIFLVTKRMNNHLKIDKLIYRSQFSEESMSDIYVRLNIHIFGPFEHDLLEYLIAFGRFRNPSLKSDGSYLLILRLKKLFEKNKNFLPKILEYKPVPMNIWMIFSNQAREITETKVKCSFTIGDFISRNEFEYTNKSNNVFLDLKPARLEIYESMTSMINVDLAYIDKCIFVDLSVSAIYIPLLSPPRCYLSETRKIDSRFRQDSVILLKFKEPLWQTLQYFRNHNVECVFTSVLENTKTEKFIDIYPIFELDLDEEVKWRLQCLCTSYGSSFRHQINDVFLSSLKICDNILGFLDHILWVYMRDRFTILEHIRLESYIDSVAILPHHRMIKRIIITPSRIIFCIPENILGSRIVRTYDNKNMLIVDYREENLKSKINSEVVWDEVLKLFPAFLLGQKVYRFMGGSGSQIRTGKGWFWCGEDSVEQILCKQVQEVPTNMFPGKYLSRIGLCFSGSIEIMSLKNANISYQPDIKENDVLFTDGCGTVSNNILEKVMIKMKLKNIPSAIQIRHSGIKGVLVLDPHLPDDTIIFRESMKKFGSDNDDLEVVSVAGESFGYLNYHIITLLHAQGVDKITILYKMKIYIRELADMFCDPLIAKRYLLQTGAMGEGDIEDILSLDEKIIIQEPFFKNMLHSVYGYYLKKVAEKGSIKIERSKNLMGVADFHKSLQEGEVFLFCSSMEKPVTGTVVVLRHPINNPDRILTLKAVDCKALHHIRDAIVFPTTGRVSHPSQTAGDLDGDRYWVCWDQDLIPSQTLSIPEFQRDDLGDYIIDYTRKYEYFDSYPEFFGEFQKKNNLGKIANVYLASSNLDENGPYTKDSLLFSQLADYAVDFLKGGIAVKDINLPEYPQFMEKTPSTKNSEYVSICDVVYSRAKLLQFHNISSGVTIDENYLAEGYESHIPSAETIYRRYCYQLEGIRLKYGIDYSIYQIFSGKIMDSYKHLHEELYSISNTITKEYAVIVEDIKLEFNNFEEDQKAKVASAFYFVAYSNAPYYLHFPWIFSEYLITIPDKVTEDDLERHLLNAHNIIEIYSEYYDRISFVQELIPVLLKVDISAKYELFGSLSTLLFDQTSDIDIAVISNFPIKEFMDILLLEFGAEKVRFLDQNDVIRVQDDFQVDIKANSTDGIFKKNVVRYYCLQYSWMLPSLRLLVQWGKASNLIGMKIFTSTGFVFLFIDFCITKNLIKSYDSIEFIAIDDDNFEACFEYLSSSFEHGRKISEVLLEFYKYFGYEFDGSIIQLKDICNPNKFTVDVSDPEYFASICVRSYNSLLYHRNFESLIEDLQNETTEKKFKLNYFPSTIDIPRLEAEMDLKITLIRPVNTKSYYLEAKGKPENLKVLREFLRKQESKFLVSGGTHRHVDSSSLMLMEGLDPDDRHTKLEYQTYTGHCSPLHANKKKETLSTDANSTESNYRNFREYQKAILHQLRTLSRVPLKNHQIRYTIRFGIAYLIQLDNLVGSKSFSNIRDSVFKTKTPLFQTLEEEKPKILMKKDESKSEINFVLTESKSEKNVVSTESPNDYLKVPLPKKLKQKKKKMKKIRNSLSPDLKLNFSDIDQLLLNDGFELMEVKKTFIFVYIWRGNEIRVSWNMASPEIQYITSEKLRILALDYMTKNKPDIRFYINSFKEVTDDEILSFIQENPIQIIDLENYTHLSEHYKIKMIRQKYRQVYTKKGLPYRINLSRSVEFQKLEQEICEMSVEFDSVSENLSLIDLIWKEGIRLQTLLSTLNQ